MSEPTNKSVFEIDLSTAQNWVQAYVKSKGLQPCVRAFLIDASELREILDESKHVKYVRVYFGLDTQLPQNEEKMMLVPVNGMGVDMINEKGPNSNIFDFTLPCPPTCDRESPLSVISVLEDSDAEQP